MKKIYPLIFLALLVMACNNNDQNVPTTTLSDSTSTDSDSNKIEEPIAVTECFQQISENDTVTLQVITKGQDISGTLNYKLEEKDLNKGSISGKMIGDTLHAVYKFQSEGVTSEREVAFLKTPKGYVEGYGEPVDSNGVMKFRTDKPVQFTDSLLLKKINCN